jgi:hypothetical protein
LGLWYTTLLAWSIFGKFIVGRTLSRLLDKQRLSSKTEVLGKPHHYFYFVLIIFDRRQTSTPDPAMWYFGDGPFLPFLEAVKGRVNKKAARRQPLLHAIRKTHGHLKNGRKWELIVRSASPGLFEEFSPHGFFLSVQNRRGLFVIFPFFVFPNDTFFFNHPLKPLDSFFQYLIVVNNDMRQTNHLLSCR